jgi:hypothetical protein
MALGVAQAVPPAASRLRTAGVTPASLAANPVVWQDCLPHEARIWTPVGSPQFPRLQEFGDASRLSPRLLSLPAGKSACATKTGAPRTRVSVPLRGIGHGGN